jgi:hypothetical protein
MHLARSEKTISRMIAIQTLAGFCHLAAVAGIRARWPGAVFLR